MIELDDIDPALHDGVTSLADDMRAQGYSKSEPVRTIFALLGDRWSMLILLVLMIGRWRHAELRRALARLSEEGKISQRVMTLKLRQLERDGLVIRFATAHIPPRVSYELSPLGQSLVAQAKLLMGWVHAHQGEIHAAQQLYDQRDM